MDKLRIFYASHNSPNDSINSDLWRANLLFSLKDLGHEVIEFDYDLQDIFKNLDTSDPIQKEYIIQHRPLTSQALLDQIQRAHDSKPIDIFFSYFYDACILPETIDQIRKMGIISINWFCNGSYQMNLVSEISPHYDYCLVPEYFRIEDYKKMGANPIYFQEAANPNIYKSFPLSYDYDVTFIGQNYGNRAEYIRYLVDHDVDVRVWGIGWVPKIGDKGSLKSSLRKFKSRMGYGYSLSKVFERVIALFSTKGDFKLPTGICGKSLNDQELIEMYSRSRINLGFSVVGDTHQTKTPIKQVRLRDFEIPMSAGFYLTEYLPELESFYEVGREIVCYSDKEDLLQKIQYYLNNPEERERIRWAGYDRAHKDHTWQKRFTDLFSQI